MSLKRCLSKAGAALRTQDREAIEARAAALQADGTDQAVAEAQAVDEQIAAVEALLAKPAAKPVSAPAPAKIDDFGEKLAGARKDYATVLKEAGDVSVSAEPLSKSWPEPDYQKLLDAGTDPWTVAFLHAVRDSVPTKPQNSWKLKRWVSDVETKRNFAEKLASGLWKRDAVEPFVRPGGSMRDIGANIDLYEDLGHARSFKGIEVSSAAYSMYQGKAYSPAKIIWTVSQKAKATAFGNWPRELASGDTRAEAMANFKAKLDMLDLGTKAKGQPQYQIYRRRSAGTDYIIGKKIGRETIDLKTLPDLKAAREFMANNGAELDALLAKYKQTPLERRPDNQPRVGDDHRNGAPVTPNNFADTFGFRGVQFGNYVEQGRRQSDLNETYDALMDMAAVLGIPARALSLGGRLGLAFGARGRGGKNAPAAHYEPGTVVINLTKAGGPGSLAHEWWHALDNYFAKESGGGGYATDGGAIDELRAEMQAAFRAVSAATQAKGLRDRSRELDKRRGKPYWDTPLELSARSFESYVVAKLQDQGAANDYLANVVNAEAWDMEENARAAALGKEAPPSFPYPAMAEMPAVRAAFDNFFHTVQTKEDADGNIALFSRDGDTAPLGGMPVNQVKQIVADITAGWSNMPPVRVVAKRLDLPVHAPYDTRGFYNGQVWIVARNMHSPEDVAKTLAHEAIAHHGLRTALGNTEFAKLTRQIQMAIKTGNKPLSEIARYVRETYVDEAGDFNLNPTQEADEIAAKVVEDAVDASGQFRPGFGFVKQAYARLAQWLRETMGIKVPFTMAELHGMLVSAQQGLQVGSRTGGRMAQPRELGEAFQRGEEVDGAFARGPGNGNTGQASLFQPNIWSTPEPTRIDRIIYELQDGRVDLKRVQTAIEQSGQQIKEEFDARLAETLYPGRVAYRSQSFLDSEAKPLLQAMSRNKVSMDELADYLHARGAEERNVQVAKVNPNMPDGGAGTNTKGDLMTTANAAAYLAGISPQRMVLLKALAARVDAITAGTRELLVAEGLEKQETIDAWTAAYKNYVPMFRDEAAAGAPHPTGSGFTVKGSASKRATGSTKEVTNILAHVLMQREAAITRAEKNRVALALYGQALSHPNPEFWTTIKPSMTAASIGAELQAMGVDPMTAQVGMEGVPTIRTVDPVTGKMTDRPNPLYKSLPGAIPLKVNGEDRVLMLNTTGERGQRLAESLKNLDGLTKLDLANSIIGKATRWLAAVNTQYNPAFGLANLTRDVFEGAINLGSTALRGHSTRVIAGVPFAIQGIARELAGNSKGNPWGDLYRQFVADGGQTGYKENFRDANDRAAAIEKELAAVGRGKLSPSLYAHAALELLEGFNTSMENGVRLSAYKVALDNGMSRGQAARLGRELTVDFNRKGRAGREIGPLYAFFNASVQGSERALRTLTGPTGAKIIAGGLALGVIQALMLAAAGYDDDEIPEFVKTRALIIPVFGAKEKRYVSIPMPLGFLWVPNTGRVVTELVLNGGKQVAKRITGAIGEIAGTFNPLGGGNIFTADGALKTVAPTLVDPLIEIGFNKNFAGGTIEKQSYGGETDGRPGVARAKESTMRTTTGQAYIGISKALNAIAGGTDYEAGVVSPTPERLRYIAQTVGGGVLREIEKSVNASTAASRGEPVKPSQIPVLGRFYGEVDPDQVQTSRYYESTKRLKTLDSSFKAMAKAGDREALQKFMDENPDVVMAKAVNTIQSKVSALNKIAVQTVGDPAMTKQIDDARVQNMTALNDAIKEMERSTSAPTLGDKLRAAMKPKAAEAAP
ncbi:hypothetical protein RD110_15515 [Rhodoferax koreense]|uniref:Large polyvalent protein-associated domain-containing protein n=1 Tax=Rhodoferax koreensis TaxID=1842727 RepID=A0A1P8JXE8_9BURK|nr:LPD5 domain-containing protein [Rhodoferax koreense]APW38430.1 hypothetical protein RD110_15515 [Rhodoferax koreense]